ncbi:MAG: uroporphyrinogen decarboxylase family protein [Candidatus Omnitrophota bacterium]
MKETMTGKERWLAVLQRKSPDRIPMDYWSTPEVDEKLKKHFGCAEMEEVFKRLRIDRPLGVGPEYVGPKVPEGFDIYGCQRRTVDYGTGSYQECVSHPLAEFTSTAEIEQKYAWPSIDHYDFSAVKRQVAGKDDRPVVGGGSEPFLTYKQLRGDIQAFVDLVENPEIIEYCLGKLFGFQYELTRRIYEAIPGKVDISYVAEDLGAQEGLMYSPDQIRRFFLPWMKRMMELVHQGDGFVFFHSDGSIRKIIPEMIATGVDILNPIQWRCKGMEKEGLKKDFGGELIFHGGVDNQQILPFGTAAEVRAEVIEDIEIFGKGGGYILAPCHNIQPVTPVENIVAMYETGYEYGWVE